MMDQHSVDPRAVGDASPSRPSRARLFSSLPRLGATTVTVRNRVYRSAPALLRDDRVLVWQESGSWRAGGELSCRVGTSMLTVRADNLSGLEPRLEGFESFIPTETCAALVEQALASVLDYLALLAGLPVEGGDFVRAPAGDGDPQEVSAGFMLFDKQWRPISRGSVRASPEVWKTFDFERQVSIPGRRHQLIPLRLSIELGRLRLAARDLASLVVGDALRPSTAVARHAKILHVTLSDPGHRYRQSAVVHGDELRLEHLMTHEMDDDAPSIVAPGQGATASEDVLEQIECDVTFELGSLRLNVAELARLRAGQTIRMGVRLHEQPIRILANGRLVARGELAALGDELVVVVTDTSRLPHA